MLRERLTFWQLKTHPGDRSRCPIYGFHQTYVIEKDGADERTCRDLSDTPVIVNQNNSPVVSLLPRGSSEVRFDRIERKQSGH